MLEQLEGRSLKSFLAVYEQKSFSRAAERLGYVQSTVTAHIRQLEQLCGRPLFNRLARGAEPTEAGHELAPLARRFAELGETIRQAMDAAGEPRGSVRLRTLESFCVSYLPDVLQSFLTRYPHVTVELTGGFHRDTVEAAAAREIDFGIVPGDPRRDDIAFEPLAEESLVFVASPPFAASWEKDGPAALKDRRVIGFGSRCVYQTIADEALSGCGVRHADRLEYASLEMIKQTVRTGLGIAFVPELSVREDVAAGRLAVLSVGERRTVTHGIVRRKGVQLTAAARALRAQLLRHFDADAADID